LGSPGPNATRGGDGGGAVGDARLERMLSVVSARLEAHIAETSQRFAAFRAEISAGGGRAAHHAQDGGEVLELRARVASLEAALGSPRAARASSWDTDEDGDTYDLTGAKAGGGGLFAGWFGSQPEPAPRMQTATRHTPAAAWAQEPADAVVSLESSIWDCALVILLHQGCSAWRDPRQQWYLGAFNILQTWVLLWLNGLVQVLFVIAVHSMSKTDGPAANADSILDARLMVGHLFSEIDRKSMMTRAERTCNGQLLDSLSSMVGDISEYLDPSIDKGILALPGNIICFLAMLFWVVEMTVEIRRCADLFLVVRALPNTDRTVIEETGAAHILKGVNRCHKVWAIVFVLLPRFLISMFLLTYGKRFLANTTEVSELILNTCALEFIRNVDDMILQALATRTLLLFTQNARIFRFDAISQQPLLGEEVAEDFEVEGRVPPSIARRHGSAIEALKVACAAVFVVLHSYSGYHNLIQPFAKGAQIAYENACDGNLRFTYLLHPVTDTPIFAQADESTQELISMRCFYSAQYEMVRMRAGLPPSTFAANASLTALVNGSARPCQASFGHRPEVPCPEMDLLQLGAIQNIGEAGYFSSPLCADLDVAYAVIRNTCLSPAFYHGSSIRELSFFEGATSCADLVDACSGRLQGNFTFRWYEKLRKVCARTCGQCRSSEVVAAP